MKYLAIGPGGMGFFSLLGALSKINTESVEEISGSSAGALLAALWVSNKGKTEKILSSSLDIDVQQITKFNIRCLLTRYGLIPISNVMNVLLSIFQENTGMHDPTFQQLYEYNPIKLHISSLCLEKRDVVYFSVDTHPNMSVCKALTASVSIPFLFEPVKHDDMTYVDAAMIECCPALPFVSKPKEQTFAIMVNTGSQIDNTTLFSYFSTIINCVLVHRYSYDLPKIVVNLEDIDCLNFKMTTEEKLMLYTRGFK